MQQPTILVFHPDPVEVRVLKGMLRTAGYRVRATEYVTEATEILTTERIDVVIVDGSLGDAGPTRFLADARVAYPDLPRLLIADSERSEHALKAIRNGQAQGIIRRPASSVELLGAVELALSDPDALDPATEVPADPAGSGRFVWTESETG